MSAVVPAEEVKGVGAGKHLMIGIISGTESPTKVTLAILTGFAAVKNGATVDFLLMGDGGSLIKDGNLRKIIGFGLPPVAKFLDSDELSKSQWFVWHYCANARGLTPEDMGERFKENRVTFGGAVEGVAELIKADKALIY